MDFWLCFICSARYCELLPGDLGSSAIFLKDLIGQAFNCYHLSATVVAVELDFFLPQSAYSVHITIRCEGIPSDLEALKLEVESIVSQLMLQCFWEIHYSEC